MCGGSAGTADRVRAGAIKRCTEAHMCQAVHGAVCRRGRAAYRAPRGPAGVAAAVYSSSGQSPPRTGSCYRDRPAPCFGSRLTQSCTMTTPFTDFAPPAPRVLTIGALEAAINRARAAQPATGAEAVLSREVSVLAKLYGRMIWDREAERPWETLTDTERVALQLWAAPVGRQA